MLKLGDAGYVGDEYQARTELGTAGSIILPTEQVINEGGITSSMSPELRRLYPLYLNWGGGQNTPYSRPD